MESVELVTQSEENRLIIGRKVLILQLVHIQMMHLRLYVNYFHFEFIISDPDNGDTTLSIQRVPKNLCV